MKKNYTKYHYDFNSLPWLTSPRRQLELQGVALGLINLPPDEGYTFTHKHKKQEEVYIVIKGNGQLMVDDEILELTEGDMVRVSPESRRALKAGSPGMFVICSGGSPRTIRKTPMQGISSMTASPITMTSPPGTVEVAQSPKETDNCT